MAAFKTHLAGGIAVGVGVAAVSFISIGLTITQSFAVFIVGAIGGILPDLDSDSGKPLTLLFNLISILIPAIFITNILQKETPSPEFFVSYFVISFFLLNTVVCGIIKKMTTHRGIMHSIPFAVLCGGIGYLLFASSGRFMASVAGFAVFLGCMVHLVLDELNSFTLKLGIIPWLKRSSGTALKIKSNSLLTTIFIYLLLVIVTVAIILVYK